MKSKVNRISASEARMLLEKDNEIILLDVRQPEEYEKGHIPGAVLIPLPELPDKLAELSTKKKILTYCRLGRRSYAAAQLIADEKGVEVYTIDGGIMAWDGLVAKGEIEEGFRALIRDLKRQEELLRLAYWLEDGSRRFYMRVAEIFSEKKAKELFGALSSAEENHMKRISEHWPNATLDDRFSAYMEGGIPITKAIERITSDKMSILETLEYSMQTEVNSLDLYLRIGRIFSEDAKELFREIIDEEKSHLKRLGELISDYERKYR